MQLCSGRKGETSQQTPVALLPLLLGKQAGGLTPNTSLHIGPDREPLLCSAVHEEGPGQGIPKVGQGEGTLEPCARQPAAPDVSPSVSHRPGYQGSVLLWHTQVINTA